MDEETKINIGDLVTVEYGHAECLIRGVVKYIPQSAGESWCVEDATKVYYISNFDVITKMKNAPESK